MRTVENSAQPQSPDAALGDELKPRK